jgi:hypothetical protein
MFKMSTTSSNALFIATYNRLLVMEQRPAKFQFNAPDFAVYVVLWCIQHSLEHPTRKSLVVLGRVILVVIPYSSFFNST